MALKAGRVGLAWQDVDENGHLKNGGGSTGVTDVKVNGESVVEDGVATITIEDLSGETVLEETSVLADADIAVLTLTGNSNVNLSYKGGFSWETKTVGEQANVMICSSSDSGGAWISVAPGSVIELNRDISGEYPVFLFDDVLSELDEKRKEYVLSGIGERQIIITSCEKDYLNIPKSRITEVNRGIYNKAEK